ncbi:ABC transporter permease [Catellatospora citrea]|uniref:ABC transporter permease n=1 Tax=Catellatospora citrea TaxID=53366 RepID=A0A8J3KQX1_9ACTN|nr:ABC transporter permease [Catellatospora citrea]RKE09696.1 hypothetical protein C8E86_4586 [Catellatospora citrea]GIG03269.1 ABC transporter permease [Catellatospora citrea]
MTAPASTYPTAVADLVPLARQWAAELGVTPSRNGLMKRFRIGDNKANAVLAALTSTTPDERVTAATAPAAPVMTDVAGPGPEITTEPAPVVASPQAAVDAAPGPVIAPTPVAPVAAPTTAALPVVKARPKVRSWPVFLIGLGAFVGIWSGWVELGALTGFGVVHPLPGIADNFSINTAITLPLGMEAYAAYALKAWMTSGVPARARKFAKWSTIIALMVGALGQIAYHLMAAQGITAAPWQITTAVACLPVIVLGLAATLAHLLANDEEAAGQR